MYAGIEAGGTKFVCAIADASGHIHREERFATEDPLTTLGRVGSFLAQGRAEWGEYDAIGLASFGPVELRKNSDGYGFIGGTPKPGWSAFDILGALRRVYSGPLGFDTDVNAAGLAEHRWGAAQDVDNLVYLTVGTGVGGGVLVGGQPVHGLMHPEVGHVFPRRHALDADFAGVCPYHGDCMEGLASGPAIAARSGAPLSELPADHLQWQLQGDYLGQLCALLVMTVSPQRIILGGGVMSQSRLLPLIRTATRRWVAGYVDRPELGAGIDRFIVAPRLGDQAGIRGALVLAANAARDAIGQRNGCD
jgi:fructokinase